MKVFYIPRGFCRMCENDVGSALVIAPRAGVALEIYRSDLATQTTVGCEDCRYRQDLLPSVSDVRELHLDLSQPGVINLERLP